MSGFEDFQRYQALVPPASLKEAQQRLERGVGIGDQGPEGTPGIPEQLLGRDSFIFEEMTRTRPTLGPPTEDFSGLGMLGQIAAEVGISFLPGGAAVRAPLQLLGVGAFDVAQRRAQGQDLDAAVESQFELGTPGQVAAVAEAVSGPVGKGIGKTIDLGREAMAAGRTVFRRMRGAEPLPVRTRLGPVEAPFRSQLNQGAEDAFETAIGEGVMIPAGQLVNHNLVNTVQNVVESSVFGGGSIRAIQIAGRKKLSDLVEQTVENLPRATREETTATLDALLSGRTKEIRGVAQGLFRQVDEQLQAGVTDVISKRSVSRPGKVLGPDGKPVTITGIEFTGVGKEVTRNGVNIGPLVKRAQQLLLDADPAAFTDPGIVSSLANVAPEIRKLAQFPDIVTYQQAQQIRSQLLDMTEVTNLEKTLAVTKARGDAIGLLKLTDNAIDQAIDRAPKEVRPTLDLARRLWREEVNGVTTQRYAKMILKRDPEQVFDAVIRRPHYIRELRRILFDPVRNDKGDVISQVNPQEARKTWANMQGLFVQRILQNNRRDVSVVKRFKGQRPMRVREFDGNKLVADIDRVSGVDSAVTDALFPDKRSQKVIDNLQLYASALKHSQAGVGNAGGTGTVGFNLLQFGALGGALGLTFVGKTEEAGRELLEGPIPVIFIGPAALARMFTNETTNRWLSVGAAGGRAPGAQQLARIAVTVLGDLLVEDLLEPTEAKKAREIVEEARSQLKLPQTDVFTPGEIRLGPAEVERLEEAQVLDLDRVHGLVRGGNRQ